MYHPISKEKIPFEKNEKHSRRLHANYRIMSKIEKQNNFKKESFVEVFFFL